MNSCELVTFISTLACGISVDKTPDEISLLSTFFVQLGDTLATIATTKSLDC